MKNINEMSIPELYQEIRRLESAVNKVNEGKTNSSVAKELAARYMEKISAMYARANGLKRKFREKLGVCPICGEPGKHSVYYDERYCPDCDVWIEDRTGAESEFEGGLPEKPSMAPHLNEA